MKPTVRDIAARLAPVFEEREAMSVAKIVVEHLEEKGSGDDEIQQIINRLSKGEPVQYVVGKSWFYGRAFDVNAHVLIPRPETEELVYWVVQDWKSHEGIRILDIGTGSGCIPVTLGLEMPNSEITAIDISRDALAVAQSNASKHDVNVDFSKLDYLKKGDDSLGMFDVIVSNPPYISNEEFGKLPDSVKAFEPQVALAHESGDPLVFYRAIANTKVLKKGGAIYLELNEFHAEAIERLFVEQGFKTELQKDMQGKVRMLKGELR